MEVEVPDDGMDPTGGLAPREIQQEKRHGGRGTVTEDDEALPKLFGKLQDEL